MSAVASTTVPPPMPATYRISRSLRRTGIYCAVGSLLILGLAALLQLLGVALDRGAVLGAPFLVGMLLLVPFVFRYRLRVDEAGLWRHRLWGWDLWSWEAFATGQVRRDRGPAILVHTGKPLWLRTLSLNVLDESDCDTVKALVDQRCPLPPPLPAEIRVGWGFPHALRLREEGIWVGVVRPENGRCCPWPEVKQVWITRRDHSCRDFRSLELVLDGWQKPIRVRRPENDPSKADPKAENIVRYLEQHVPAERIEVTAERGEPRDVAEASRRLTRLDTLERERTRVLWLCTILWWAGVGWMLFLFLQKCQWNAWQLDGAAWLLVGTMLFMWGSPMVVCLIAFYSNRARLRAQRAELISWQSAHANAQADIH